MYIVDVNINNDGVSFEGNVTVLSNSAKSR